MRGPNELRLNGAIGDRRPRRAFYASFVRKICLAFKRSPEPASYLHLNATGQVGGSKLSSITGIAGRYLQRLDCTRKAGRTICFQRNFFVWGCRWLWIAIKK